MSADFNWNDFEAAELGSRTQTQNKASNDFDWNDFEVAEFSPKEKTPSRFEGGLLQGIRGEAEQRPVESAIGKEGTGFVGRQITAGIPDFLESLSQLGDPRNLINLFRESPEEVPEGIFGKLASKIRGPEEELTSEEIEAGRELGNVGQLALDFPLSKILKSARGLTQEVPKLIPRESQREFVENLVKRGFTPEEITPLLQGQKKSNILSKVAHRGEKTIERLKATRNRIGESAEKIREIGKDLPGLSGKRADAFKSSFNRVLKDTPKRLQRILKDDIQDLMTSDLKASDLYDFYRSIGKVVNDASDRRLMLNALKDPVLKGMKMINPSLEKEFKFTNRLFSDLYSLSKKMTPNRVSEIFDAGEIIGVGKAVFEGSKGNIGKMGSALQGIIGATGSRVLARELLINPKLQNIAKRLEFLVRNGNTKGIERVSAQLISEISKDNPEVIEEWDIEKS